jgi:hypothetical protein
MRRTAKPISQPITFGQQNVAQTLYERQQRRRRHSNKTSCNLGVEDTRRRNSTRMIEHFKILLRSMNYAQHV